MAEIFVAKSSVGVCVVKKLLPQHATNEEYLQMFEGEGRLAMMFDHPNIVKTFDFGTEAGSPYLAMEYLHGEDVRTVLRTLRHLGQRMPLSLAVAIAMGVAEGIHHAHEKRGATGEPLEIVHRDVSPHNVFVTFDGAIKVVDFGIAKSTDRNWETRHGTLKGKVPYMAPEQIKGKRLDRRVDIYAIGILLYELVLGRRPYVLATSGDFAMMMAIARNDIRLPAQVDPKIAPELERIILKAMAYDPKDRYATASALRDELAAYARAARLGLSQADLSEFLASLFGARYAEWRAAQTSGAALAKHVVQVEEERAQSGLRDDDGEDATEVNGADSPSSVSEPLPLPSSRSIVASASAAVSSVVEVFGVTVVTLQGRIDESFDGAALGGSLSGTVLFDLAGVERITSFGVREWLEMMSAIDTSEDAKAYLARCPEAVVTQLSIVKAFGGRSLVVSFDVPFLCDDCGNAFTRTLDCQHDAVAIAGGAPPSSTCPRCGGEAKLDDDPSYLAFASEYAGRLVPDRVRVVLEKLDEVSHGAGDAVDKMITANETRVRVHRDVGPSFRWNRVLDGLEGAVVVDFRGAPRFGPDAAVRFARAIAELGPEVTSCEIVEGPVEIVAALGTALASGRATVGSMAFEGRCASCAAQRTGAVGQRALAESFASRHALFVPCRRCNAALELGDITPAMNALFASSVPEERPAPASSRSPIVISQATPAAIVRTRAPAVAPRWPYVVAAVLALGGVGFGGLAAVRHHGAHASPQLPVSSAPPPVVAPPLPAVETRVDGHYVTVTAREKTEDAALVAARAEAIALFIAALEPELPAPVRLANEAEAVEDHESAATRFTDQVGAFASPDRVDVKRRMDGELVVVNATYRIDASAWERAHVYYAHTEMAAGITFAQAFPWRGPGLVVVTPDSPESVTKGSIVEQVDGHPVRTLEQLATLKRGKHSIELRSHGERLEARLYVK